MNEWEDEPSLVIWHKTLSLDYICMAKRHPSMGFLCGYVGVPPGHPAYGQGYSEEALYDIHVHGGLTYADESRWEELDTLPDDWWWLGFDCGHGGDIIPKMPYTAVSFAGDTYRNISYVIEQCESLAEQLDALK